MIKAATTEEESNGGGTACGGDELAGGGGTTSPVLVSEPLRPITEVTDYPICRPNPRKPRSRISSPISLLSSFLLTSPRGFIMLNQNQTALLKQKVPTTRQRNSQYYLGMSHLFLVIGNRMNCILLIDVIFKARVVLRWLAQSVLCFCFVLEKFMIQVLGSDA